jgi:branched-chain amino acid transport system ATP-binding protein
MAHEMIQRSIDTNSTLEVSAIRVVYNRIQTAVEEVSLTVAPGQLVALLGSNGSGKTTTLRAISGFLPIDRADVVKGEIALGDLSIKGLPPSAIAQRGLVLVPERDKVFTTLTVEENLRVVAGQRNEVQMKLIHDLFPILRERGRQPAGLLSGGERQMLAIARGLLLHPKVMLIDELSFGLAPGLAQRLLQMVARICKEQHVSVLMVEQNAAAALSVADYAYIMERGKVVLHGEPASLEANTAVREFFLGLGEGSDGGYRNLPRSKTANSIGAQP